MDFSILPNLPASPGFALASNRNENLEFSGGVKAEHLTAILEPIV
jgi:hypothetical protein